MKITVALNVDDYNAVLRYNGGMVGRMGTSHTCFVRLSEDLTLPVHRSDQLLAFCKSNIDSDIGSVTIWSKEEWPKRAAYIEALQSENDSKTLNHVESMIDFFFCGLYGCFTGKSETGPHMVIDPDTKFFKEHKKKHGSIPDYVFVLASASASDND